PLIAPAGTIRARRRTPFGDRSVLAGSPAYSAAPAGPDVFRQTCISRLAAGARPPPQVSSAGRWGPGCPSRPPTRPDRPVPRRWRRPGPRAPRRRASAWRRRGCRRAGALALVEAQTHREDLTASERRTLRRNISRYPGARRSAGRWEPSALA